MAGGANRVNWYPWLNRAYHKIIAQYQANRAHHALLLHALPGIGDAALVWALSRWLMCQKHNGMKSCGSCHDCQLMQAGTHPDWYTLTAEKEKSPLGVDGVRNVTKKLNYHALQGGAKIVWLPNAEQLTEAAANALLKTLEEPPENSWFFLCCHEPRHLLATIRSRCARWHLLPPDEAQSLSWLQKKVALPEQTCLTALRLNSGMPIAALTLLDEKRWQQRQLLCRTLFSLLPQDLLSLLPVLNHEDVVERISWLCFLLVDAMKHQQGAEKFITNLDQQPLIGHIAHRLTLSTLDESLHSWLICRDHLSHVVSVNRELLLTEQLLHWEMIVSASNG